MAESTTNDRTVVDLRNNGYVVVVFTPEELQSASPDKVSERLIEFGWEVIDCHNQ